MAVEGLIGHGLGVEPVAPDWPAISAGAVEQLLRRFPGVGELRALTWHSPRPFSAACLVSTSTGSVFVKRHHRSVREPGWLSEEHRFMAHLRRNGVPVVEVLADEQGETAIAIGEWTYEVHAIAAGQDLYREALSWTPFAEHRHALAAGQALARLHEAAAGYCAPPRQAPVLLANFRLFNQRDPIAAIEHAANANPALADYLNQRNWRSDLTELHLPFHRALYPLLAEQQPLWTHNDWHASNLLWNTESQASQVSSVLDFGLADQTFALFDLATALERNCVPWLELDSGDSAPASLESVDAIVAGYQRVRPLSAQDFQTLAALLPLVHTDFALSEIAYYQGVVGSVANANIAYDAYLMGHTRWFNGAEGQRLLTHINSLAESVLS
ncbi:phosphotransferase enzyme family protein [Pseudomonas caspiana]|uniref:Aminoglycoside phosphotransferase n=1 Tax=Pseudomonas caspiana TaxID=1451454 RepID=A0A1Y3P0F5_9PSED|nr:phosphotransferase [Pseudomonas caspiana]OUM73305.1 aminoglycoside phosphotransferase [Pseudomonas caspiana]